MALKVSELAERTGISPDTVRYYGRARFIKGAQWLDLSPREIGELLGVLDGDGCPCIGVVGKDGTGKAALSGLITQAYADRGLRVVAIDTDSNPNLAFSLGLDEQTAAPAPLVPRRLAVGSGADMTAEQLLAALLAEKARIEQRLAVLREP